jgi:sn-glycerol 3-phosphate transport system permease protein
MEKRVRFQSRWLPWMLVAPQMAIVLVFFFWPAGQALYQSVLSQDAFGLSTEFVGLENFERLFADSTYIESFKTTAVFSLLVAVSGLVISLLLAAMADRVQDAQALRHGGPDDPHEQARCPHPGPREGQARPRSRRGVE